MVVVGGHLKTSERQRSWRSNVTGVLEEVQMGWKTTSPDLNCKLFRNVSLTRLVFGLALSALIAVGTFSRTNVTHSWLTLSAATHLMSSHHLKPFREPLDLYKDVDAACTSRGQQYRYRKEEYQFPTPQRLSQALSKYSDMHSQCALSDGIREVKAGCQYVVYVEGYEGVGNRLLSLVSAFVYALVTQRTLMIDGGRGHLTKVLCEPFKNSSWLLPSQFADEVVQQASTLGDAASRHFKNVSSVRVNLRHEQTPADQKFLCAEMQRGLKNVTWIAWQANQYYIPRLFMSPEFWPILHPLFPDVSLVSTHLSRYLWLPQNPIWERITNIQESYLASSKVQVGLQIRRHSVPDSANFSSAVHKLIMDCLLDNRILPKPAATPQHEGLKPGDDINGRANLSTVAVLVTSLQDFYYDKMREEYIEHGTEDGSVVSVHMVSQEGAERYSYEQAVKALSEMWLLSFSQKLATSSWSTFGYVAQALGGSYPYILNIRGEDPQLQNITSCTMGQSIDPCLHYPFTEQCTCESDVQMSSEHSQWIAKHVKSCQDETRGLQLCPSLSS